MITAPTENIRRFELEVSFPGVGRQSAWLIINADIVNHEVTAGIRSRRPQEEDGA